MHRESFVTVPVLLAFLLVPCAGAVSMTINATPAQAHIGEVITLTGTITGVKTIAVYLFVTGPDLNMQGVTLENLNIPTGRGLFTTAPVNMADGSWKYVWDTAVILGNLKPGKYTIYVVSSPVDRLRFVAGEFATVEVEILPKPPSNQTPVPLMLPLVAPVLVAAVLIPLQRKKREEDCRAVFLSR